MSVFEQDVSDELGGWIIPVNFALTFLGSQISNVIFNLCSFLLTIAIELNK